MRARILAVGNEVVFGDIVNTNAAFLARRLQEMGIDVEGHEALKDDLDVLVRTISQALAQVDLVLLVGGLGPTVDDMTREALAQAVGRPLVLDSAELLALEGFFRNRGLQMPERNRRQVHFPEGALPLKNPRGTAPGVWYEADGKIAVAFPGPPHELEGMFEDEVVPRLAGRVSGHREVVWLRVAGLGESFLEERLGSLMGEGNPSLLPYAKRGEVHLRLMASAPTENEAKALVLERQKEVFSRIGRYIYGTDGKSLEETVLDLLRSRGETLATQESATGGWLAKRLTDPPGASEVYLGGTVVYSVLAKERLGGLLREDILREGPVSRETAQGLARTAREALGATWGLATCGWAGPQGDGEMGLGYFALDGPSGTQCTEIHAPGVRDDFRHRLTQSALIQLLKTLQEGANGI